MKAKNVISFILIMVLIAAFASVCAFDIQIGNFRIPSVMGKVGLKQGLDLVGGSIIVFEPDVKDLSKVTAGQMDTAESILRARLDGKGLNEATISRQGDTGIRVEIPDIDDPQEAIEMIGQTAKLEFRYIYTTPDENGNERYALAMEGSTDYVDKAEMKFGQTERTGNQQYYVSLDFTSKGRDAFSVATQNAISGTYNGEPISNQIAIFLDETLYSAPVVNSVITDGSCIITGGGPTGFEAEKASDMANVINSGSLPFALKDAELRNVGATLGSQALKTSLLAALIGVILVMLFMLLFYRLPGLVADISLVAYISLTLLIMAGFFIKGGYRITLTLPGIAGVILSIGMAVDANVVIFERIKDELRQGKSVGAAVEGGFKRAITAVIDSNITTIIACAVLYFFGSGTIQGFAVTLFIGIVVSMFTAIFLTRWLLKLIVGFGVKNTWLYGVSSKRRDA